MAACRRAFRAILLVLTSLVVVITGAAVTATPAQADVPTFLLSLAVNDETGAPLNIGDPVQPTLLRWVEDSSAWMQVGGVPATASANVITWRITDAGVYMARVIDPDGLYGRQFTNNTDTRPDGPGAPGTFTFDAESDLTRDVVLQMPTEGTGLVTGSISGVVTDRQGEPIPDVTVWALRQVEANNFWSRGQVTTDENGAFSMFVPAGRYSIRAIAPGGEYQQWLDMHFFGDDDQGYLVVDDENTNAGNLQLGEPLDEPTARVTVTDSEGAPLPIEGALAVDLFRWNDAEGAWNLRNDLATQTVTGNVVALEYNEPGVYMVRAIDRSGARTVQFSNGTDQRPAGPDSEGTFAWTSAHDPVREVAMAMPANGDGTASSTWTGSVVDQRGNALPGVEVTAQLVIDGETMPFATAVTNDDGDFSLPVPAGDYVFSVNLPEGDDRPFGSTLAMNDGGLFHVGVGETLPTGQLVLPDAPGTIEGVVTDTEGNPIAALSVIAMDSQNRWFWASSDEDGRYVVEAPPGDYTVYLLGGWMSPQAYSDRIVPDVTVISRAGTDLGTIQLEALQPPGTITGVVTDVDGNPLSDIYVNVDNVDNEMFGGSAWTDADGGYSISVQPGDYTVYFHGDYRDEPVYESAYYAGGDSVTVASEETTTLEDMSLGLRRGQVGGIVRDDRGRPIDGVLVEAFEVGDESGEPAASAWTYASDDEEGPQHGYFQLKLDDGTYTIRFSLPEGDDRGYETTYLWDGESIDVYSWTNYFAYARMHRPYATFTGTVVDSHGDGLDNMNVVLKRRGNGARYKVWTGVDDEGQSGTFRREVPAGTYRVIVRSRSLGERAFMRHVAAPVGASSGEHVDAGTITLQERAVSTVLGLVVDQEGAPAGGANVVLSRVDGDGGFHYVDDVISSYGEGGDDLPLRLDSSLASGDEGVYTFTSVPRPGEYTVGAFYGDEGAVTWLGDVADIEDADTFTVGVDDLVLEVPEAIAVEAPCRGRVISNGTVSLGVNCLGQLNLAGPGVGLQYDETGNDGTQAGCECEGWGVADGTSRVSGYANNESGISDNLELVRFTVDEDNTTATSVVRVGDTFEITHEYVPSQQSPNVYDVNVSVKNISDAAADLRYRRVMDWDVEPTAFDEYVTMETGTARELVYASDGGFASADPLSEREDYGYVGDFVDAGPNDHGALFDFQFPSLAAGATRSFQTFYGAAGNEQDALAGLAAVDAEAYSLGQPSTEDGPTLGTPNTFLFGFAGVGGRSVFQAPTASDDVLAVVSGGSASVNVLENDSDPNHDPLTVLSTTTPAHGSVACEAGVCTYTSAGSYVGLDSFDYVVSDGQGGTDTGTVAVTVSGGPAALNSGLPLVTGAARVGGALTTTDGTWDRGGLTFTYQWLRNGVAIPSATSKNYTPVADDLDRSLSVRVTASRSSAADVTVTSGGTTITRGLAPANTLAPSLPATAANGDRLTVDNGVWAPLADRYTYQWRRDGNAISGATSRSYVVGSTDVGHTLSVVVTAIRAGHANGTATSGNSTVNRGPAPANYDRPSITGVASAGQVLTATAGSWSLPVRDLSPTYQWRKNGTPIDGATAQTLNLDSAGLANGDSITVVVTVRQADHENGVAESRPVVMGARAGTNSVAPSLSGVARVGETLTLTRGTWSDGVSLTDRWYAAPSWDADRAYRYLLGTGGTSMVIPSWASGYDIYVEETATGAETTVPVTVTSASVGPIADMPRLYVEAWGSVTGTPAVGQVLGVDSGRWFSYQNDGSRSAATPDSLDYQWYVDGELVSTASTFTPAARHGGKSVYVQLISHKVGHYDGWSYAYLSRIRFADEGVGTLALTVQRGVAPRNPVPGASVSICQVGSWTCDWYTTDGDGHPVTTSGQPVQLAGNNSGISYTVHVSPAYDSGLLAANQEVVVRKDQTTTSLVELDGLTPMPPTASLSVPNGERSVDTDGDGTTDGTYPSVFYSTVQELAIEGCPGVEDPSWTVVFSNGQAPMTGDLVETTGDGHSTYAGTIPGFNSTGLATIQTNVPAECDEQPTTFTVYIDPSGIVTDQWGRAIEGAAVTLLKRDGASFVPVADGDTSVMDPDVNTANPSRTTSTGFFRWDVTPGDYKVSVSDAHSGGVTCDVATTNAMSVPPERVDLVVKVPCVGASMPEPTVDPVMSGTERVGNTLSVTAGTWDGGLEPSSIQWMRDGQVVETGSTYALTADDAGKVITARVSARRPDYVQENGSGEIVTFDPTYVDVVTETIAAASNGGGGGGGGGGGTPTAQAPANTALPTVAGSAKVGQLLTANPGTWDTTGLVFTYQWLRAGEAISGATSADYRTTAEDLGKALSVRVTATKAGAPSTSVTSGTVSVLVGDAATVLSDPTVTGGTDLGDLLTVHDGTWSLEGLAFSYQWLRDGEPIAGATGAHRAIEADDQGHGLAVLVTATKAGHQDGSATTGAIAVPAAPTVVPGSRTTARLAEATIARTQHGLVRLRVVGDDGATAVGRVEVRVDGAVTKVVRLARADRGRSEVQLPRLKVGTHRVRAVYLGTPRMHGSRSDVVSLKVRGGKHKGGHGRPLPSLT